jgi:hypothetical protein
MTTADPAAPCTKAGPAVRALPGAPSARLVRLYLASRGVPACLLALAGCAVTLRITLHWPQPGTGLPARQFPLLIETAAAAAIGVVTRSPFGEPERGTGRWLPVLRLGAAVALTAVAFGALAAGSAAEHLDYGYLGLLRDLAGMTGIALLTAAVVGGSLSWIGPLGCWMLAAYALARGWTAPWAWPARPPHDLGAALCAALVYAAGAAVVTVRGARDSARE